MARVDNSALHDFVTGEKVTEQILDQNFKVMQAAVNDNDKVLEDLGIGSFAPATFNSLLQTSTTFNQLKFGYVKGVTDPLDTRITSLETVQTKPPAIQQFVANDGQTVFVLTNMTYDVGTGETSVEIDGITQVAGEEYTETNSTTITLVEGVPAGAEVRVIVSQTPIALSEKLAGYDTSITSVTTQLAQISLLVKPTGGDDTSNIQNAINSLTNGGRILFTPGTYLVSKTITNYVLTLNSNIELIGLKGKVTIKLNSGSGTVYMLGNSNYVENIKIKNIIFDGNYPTVNATSSPLFFPNIKNFVSEYNTYQNFGGQGTNFGDTTLAQDITHYKDYFDTILGTGILTHNNKKIVVRDCHFNNVKDSNINVTGQGVEDVETFVLLSGNVAICPVDFTPSHSVFSIMGDNSQVVNNKIVGGDTQIVIHIGAFPKNLRNYLISGNILEQGNNGIFINQDVNSKIIVSKNTIKNSLGSPIIVGGWDGISTLGNILIEGNIIDGSGTVFTQYQIPMGIKIAGAFNCIVSNNIVINPEYAGIGVIGNNKNVMVIGNTIDGHKGTSPTDSASRYGGGIYVADFSTTSLENITIDNNIVTNFMVGKTPIDGSYGAAICVRGRTGDATLLKKIIIRNNFINTGTGKGIAVNYTTDCKLAYNVIFNTAQVALENLNNVTPVVANATF